MRERRSIFHKTDWIMITLYLVLVVMGWLNIYAAVYNENHSSILDFSQKYGKQLIWIVAAFLLAMMMLLIDGKFFSQFAYLIYGLTMVLLVLVILGGKVVSSSKSWFSFGGIALQPSEFAKMGTALALARYTSGLNIDLRRLNNLAVAAVIMFFPALLVLLEHDTGSALVFISFVFVLHRAGMPSRFLVVLFALPILGVLALVLNKFIVLGLLFAGFAVTFLYTKRNLKIFGLLALFFVLSSGYVFSVHYVFENVLEAHQKTRIKILLGQEVDMKGAGYNVNQSLIAVGSGRLTGKGFLQGTQTKYNFVPEQSTDFIFCTVGEELGFIGSLIVIALFTGLFLRILFVAERQRSKFSRMYGYGVASILFFHFTINIGMAIGLIPVIGIPLPFFSYGGSSLWAFTILLFIFIRQDSYRFELL
jgi:rod shape determining protein RodA